MNANLRTVTATLGGLFCAMAAAQQYPNKRILSLANELVSNTPDEYRDYMQADIARWNLAVKEAGIKISAQP